MRQHPSNLVRLRLDTNGRGICLNGTGVVVVHTFAADQIAPIG
ncbi:hypothetical protein QPK87_19220 [Kamptonema cortianum]|nr:hypothetical protein [Kamptonema cortianum]